MGGVTIDPHARLAAKRRVTERGCIEWTGGRTKAGYGRMSVNGKAVYVHRYVFELDNGPLEPEVMVLHSCDNPPCFNREHLRAGSHLENMQDKASKGRQPPGQGTLKWRKLNAEQVRRIRAAKGTTSAIALAGEFGVQRGAIYKIWQGLTWTQTQ